MKKYFQQGDVLVFCVDEIPAEAIKQIGAVVLAEGETSGHAHRVLDIEAVALSKMAARIFLEVFSETPLTHEEHGTIQLPPGKYEVRKVREYDHFAEEAREVRD